MHFKEIAGLVASKTKLVITYTVQKMQNAAQIYKVPDDDATNLPIKILHRQNWTYRGETPIKAMSKHSLGSLSNDHGDVNENGKKSNWFKLAKRALRFFCTFL